MRMRVFWLTFLVSASLIGAPLRAADETQTQPVSLHDVRLALYAYDDDLPLNAKVGPPPKLKTESQAMQSLRTRHSVSFESVRDLRVPAVLTLPRRAKPPFPAVVLLAGSGGHKDTDYVRIASDMMNTLGFATISIDAQYHGDRSRPGRSGDIHFVQQVVSRDAWVQTVVDLRRAVDYLTSRPDVNPKKIGFVGFSQGGMIGGTLLGVEPRIVAACLAVPGGGLLEWGKRMGVVKPDNQHRFAVATAMTDPIHFIGMFSPRPLLVLAARRDELIPAAATEALYSAAREPKKLIWYNSGHVLPPTALVTDARAFLAEHLGGAQSR